MTHPTIDLAKAHVPTMVLSRDVHALVHGTSALGRLNTWVAVRITSVVGSMWCAYAFALIALVSLPAALTSGDPIIIIGWIAQTFLQLVLLPIIIVGQNVQAASSDARADSDHKTLQAIHVLSSEIHTINLQQNQILDILAKQAEK